MARVNIMLNGKASDLLSKIKKQKRGLVINLLVNDQINSGRAKALVSAIFSREEHDALFGKAKTADNISSEKPERKQKEEQKLKGTKNNVDTIENNSSSDENTFKVKI